MDEDWELLMQFFPAGWPEMAGHAGATKGLRLDKSEANLLRTILIDVGCGYSAPFAGQLLTPELAIDLEQKADSCDARVKLESDRVKKLAEIDVALARRLLEIERDAARHQVDLLTERLKKAVDVSFYERPVFVASVAVVATIAVFSAMAKGASLLR